ncbi:MAG: hypothetical protein BWX55_00061 [Deltaproteobacteria bacterium ADurb.Bin022]|mgnify:FL=1|nr:MAG: hypothetical protein BWX55_00061 [Deltaproteobacteria bacterium ADurb.Bin022]
MILLKNNKIASRNRHVTKPNFPVTGRFRVTGTGCKVTARLRKTKQIFINNINNYGSGYVSYGKYILRSINFFRG